MPDVRGDASDLPAPLRQTNVGDRLAVFSTGGETLAESFGANAVAVLGDGETLLVDPLVAPAYARVLKRLLDERGAGAVTHVVLTHAHTDHSLGASVFAAEGASVLAHPATADAMAAEHPGLIAGRRASPGVAALFADAVPVVPNRLVRESVVFEVGGLRVVVRRCGPAHTPGDLRIDLPSLGVVLTGDLVSNGYHPNLEDADLEGWRSALLDLLRMEAVTFVPGHGEPGGREIVEAQLAWFESGAALAREAGKRGDGPAAVAAALVRLYPANRLRAVLTAAAERLTATG